MKTKYFHYVILGLAIMILAACGQTSTRTQSPVEITLTQESIIFATEYALGPEDRFNTNVAKDLRITPSPTPTPTPLPTITPAMPKSVQSICLNVEQTFGEFDGPYLPIKDIAARILKNSHYSFMEIGENCDATLDIQLILWPLSENYSGNTCYTGAKATGSATLILPGKTPQKVELLQESPPITGILVILTTCPTPSQAPFTTPADRAVLQALTELIGPQILNTAIKDEDEEIRKWAIWTLYEYNLHHNFLIPKSLLLEALDDPSSDVRIYAVLVLGWMGEEADFAFDRLVSMLNDPSTEVRGFAIDSLEKIRPNDPSLIDPYRTALKDSDSFVYQRALTGLCGMGSIDLDTVPDLLSFYETHPNEEFYVRDCLSDITGQDPGDDPTAWRTWWEQRQ